MTRFTILESVTTYCNYEKVIYWGQQGGRNLVIENNWVAA
jgi:hypothetical protein